MLILTLISVVFFIPYAALIFYYWQSWKAIPIFKSTQINGTTIISVIIPARNEQKNISVCLDSISGQSYPKNLFEVIVIDDHSTDNTWEIATNFSRTGLTMKCLRLSDYINADPGAKAFKKAAIDAGINNASGNLIVTSDADCVFEKDWLQTIACFYESTRAQFIAAPVRIAPAKSLLSVFQTLDFITLQGITGGSVFKKFHSMCNGANLAYEKNAYFEVDGFKNIDNIPSGDDMLLMHKIYEKNSGGVFFLKNKKALVTTQPELNWRNFFNQRIRWASKADQYQDKRIVWVLVLVYFFNLQFLVIFFAAFWNIKYLLLALALMLLKVVVEFPFVRSVASFFDQRTLMKYFPLLQPIHILYTIIAGWLGKFGSYRWKGRTIHK
jgi:biofilm PGA synthesis N-glycosyltransferase PgaC